MLSANSWPFTCQSAVTALSRTTSSLHITSQNMTKLCVGVKIHQQGPVSSDYEQQAHPEPREEESRDANEEKDRPGYVGDFADDLGGGADIVDLSGGVTRTTPRVPPSTIPKAVAVISSTCAAMATSSISAASSTSGAPLEVSS